ncbi:MAG: AraC family transcriptional regulator [Cytophagales bacterium]|nr:AraC family transcriptional regulator [Cytophagales bacterium]
MKAQLLKISNKIEQSFSIRHDVVPVFHNRWHYHPEIEIIQIRKGTGTFIIGDAVAKFEENDIFMLGSNLPHLFRYDITEDQNYSDAYVIHFLPEFFGANFLNYPEMKAVKEIMAKSARGIHIKTNEPLQNNFHFETLHESKGFDRIIRLFNVMGFICKNTDNSLLSSLGFSQTYDSIDSERLDNIYQYVLSNFDREISLEEISGVANLSVHSFCRYFKTKTNKTFTNFLLEIRIGHACKLLLETDLNISQICFECGFNNLSNFNRYFKKFVQKTPTEYLKDIK